MLKRALVGGVNEHRNFVEAMEVAKIEKPKKRRAAPHLAQASTQERVSQAGQSSQDLVQDTQSTITFECPSHKPARDRVNLRGQSDSRQLGSVESLASGRALNSIASHQKI